MSLHMGEEAMRRQYTMSFGLMTMMSDPTAENERAFRQLEATIAAFIVERIEEYPWPVDISFHLGIDRVVDP